MLCFRNCMMVHSVKKFITKADLLVEWKTGSLNLTSDLHMCTVVHIHTKKMKIKTMHT